MYNYGERIKDVIFIRTNVIPIYNIKNFVQIHTMRMTNLITP